MYENKTKIPQVIYDKHLNPILVMPGQTFGEPEVKGQEKTEEIVKDQEIDPERIKRMLAMVRMAKTASALKKIADGETNPEILEAVERKLKEFKDG